MRGRRRWRRRRRRRRRRSRWRSIVGRVLVPNNPSCLVAMRGEEVHGDARLHTPGTPAPLLRISPRRGPSRKFSERQAGGY